MKSTSMITHLLLLAFTATVLAAPIAPPPATVARAADPTPTPPLACLGDNTTERSTAAPAEEVARLDGDIATSPDKSSVAAIPAAIAPLDTGSTGKTTVDMPTTPSDTPLGCLGDDSVECDVATVFGDGNLFEGATEDRLVTSAVGVTACAGDNSVQCSEEASAEEVARADGDIATAGYEGKEKGA